MTTNLFVIVNVKQLRTSGSFRISLPFFQTTWGVGVLNSADFKLIRMLEWSTKHFPLNLQSDLTSSNFLDVGGGFELWNQIRHCKTVCIKRNLYLINYNLCEHGELQKEIETPVLLAHVIEDSTDIFGISGGGVEHPNPPPALGTPLTRVTEGWMHVLERQNLRSHIHYVIRLPYVSVTDNVNRLMLMSVYKT